MKKLKFALAALLIIALIVGCGIATGSFTFGYEIDDTNGPGAVSGEVWLAYDSTFTDPDTVRYYGTRIFVTTGIPEDILLYINWEDGLGWIENFPEVQTAVLDSAYLVIYGLGDADIFDVELDIDIIFTVTAGL